MNERPNELLMHTAEFFSLDTHETFFPSRSIIIIIVTDYATGRVHRAVI